MSTCGLSSVGCYRWNHREHVYCIGGIFLSEVLMDVSKPLVECQSLLELLKSTAIVDMNGEWKISFGGEILILV